MVARSKRTAESSTRFTVSHIAIGKENTAFGCESVGNLTSFSHKTVFYFRTVQDRRTIEDDRIFADNAAPDIHIGLRNTFDRAVAEPASTVYLAVVADVCIGYFACIDNLNIVTDGALLGYFSTDFSLHQYSDGID